LPVSDTAQGLTLVWRVVAEHRRRVYTLLAGLVANVVVFALLVYPLQSDVANVEQRTRTSEDALAAARAEQAQASGTLTGKDRAVKELDTFYTSVLAPDLAGARRLTFARLARLAAQSRLEFDRRKYEALVERGSSLTRLKVNMELSGAYGDIRQFIHEIETAPEFVVIDKVGLSERGESGAPLHLTLELSTYYRNAQP
jgi:Tfp pilus assembly protein PilO